MVAPRVKPKTNRKGELDGGPQYDRCQTPAYALDPLLPYLPLDSELWESAAGEGTLVRGLARAGYAVVGTDLRDGHNFFEMDPPRFDIQVTNPPFSIKYPWLERAYALGRPFALLMPLETLGAARAQRLFDRHGIEIILMTPRINFKMPNKGWKGSAAQFPTAWFCSGLGIGRTLTYATLDPAQIRHWRESDTPEEAAS